MRSNLRWLFVRGGQFCHAFTNTNHSRDGTGIPPEVKEKIFNPFFTTKPAGEGTGLGLSISHDIIVKQHGGSIEVDTQPGEFTEIRVILPRVATLLPDRS